MAGWGLEDAQTDYTGPYIFVGLPNPEITGLGGGTGQQGQGQSTLPEGDSSFDWDVLSGQSTVGSGSSPTQAEAISAAKTTIAGLPAGSYGIVVRQGGATVYKENVEAGGGQPPQGQGGGEDPGTTGGSGQVADMAFRYRLTGYKWTWDDKSSPDPRNWKGHGAEYDISATGYTYGSADDALAAGRVAGDADQSVMRVFAESNYPTQFAGLQYTYSDRLTTATNAGAKEANDAYEVWKNTQTTLDLPEPPSPPGDDILSGVPQEAIIAIIVVIVVVAMIGVIMSVGVL